MFRRLLVGFAGGIGIIVAGMIGASSARAHIRHEGPATLSAAFITFHVRDHDKNHNSSETVIIACGPYRVGELLNAGSGSHWHDQSDIGPFALDKIDRDIEPSDCGKIHVAISHTSVGDDVFRFSFMVTLQFTDGTILTYEEPSTATLMKGQASLTWDLAKIG